MEAKLKQIHELLKIKYHIIDSREDVLGTLFDKINRGGETQILVTGPLAADIYQDQGIILQNHLGNNWEISGSPYAPTAEVLREKIRSFSVAVKSQPQIRHIYVGLTNEGDVTEYLFFESDKGPYSCSIYVLGIYEDHFTFLRNIIETFGERPRMKGQINVLYSLDDYQINDKFRKRISIANDRNEDIGYLSLLYFQYKDIQRYMHPIKPDENDKVLIKNSEKFLTKNIFPTLFPKDLFPEMAIRSWWKFW
jgi:hypothetical protein